jgi:hypothetical protein
MKKFLLATALVAAPLLSANAMITFSTTNTPQPDEQNIQFETPGGVTGPVIVGDTNHTMSPVQFDTVFSKGTGSNGTSGDGSIIHGQGLGQSHITCATNCNTSGTNIMTTLEMLPLGNTAWTDVIANPSGSGGGGASGPVNVFVTDNTGANFQYTLTQGSNFVTITASGGEVIADVQFTMVGAGGWTDFQQPRVSGVCTLNVTGTSCTPIPFPVPEPASLALVGVGLLGLGYIRFRRS